MPLCRITIQILNEFHIFITPNRVTSGGAHPRGLAPGQHSSEEMS